MATVVRAMPHRGGAGGVSGARVHAAVGRVAGRARPTRAHGVQAARAGGRQPGQGESSGFISYIQTKLFEIIIYIVRSSWLP